MTHGNLVSQFGQGKGIENLNGQIFGERDEGESWSKRPASLLEQPPSGRNMRPGGTGKEDWGNGEGILRIVGAMGNENWGYGE